ncbi:hypothetical protein BCR41DRAFT_303934 [Lobosporangium transversale]|uniref:COX assembly mitochondrial protein n=1 Tax=Lobosporangium transversale TaxID=64571 RepID=A0A1Y2GT61_9FUNG|nr:hypothetical protein BCR41DRAFT_303934 [Lobosporangium transversale]ORZ19292.1 hypothetical protein BCR41DRAFT_303934 [Lobosporangium transversale]|eukprot:XP_021882460.1 hypothetical protein BCR41DRAFT_303934 [Lobosporangium transversale]
MHSKLDLHKHVSCEDLILQLDRCHHENVLNRYLGRCNSLKQAMNECLQAEFDVNRKKHFEKAKARRMRYEEAWKDMDE